MEALVSGQRQPLNLPLSKVGWKSKRALRPYLVVVIRIGAPISFSRNPLTLSNSVEFEPGIGPQWSSGGKIAGAIAFDFMFWPSPDRKIGWFLEPSYSYTFSKDHEQSLGMSVGLLIAIP
jgi:hypothetical protein